MILAAPPVPLIEVHADSSNDLSDGEQAPTFDGFAQMMTEAAAVGRRIGAASDDNRRRTERPS